MALIDRKASHATLYQAHLILSTQRVNISAIANRWTKCNMVTNSFARHMMQTMDSMGTGYRFRSDDYNKLGGIPVIIPT